MGQYIQVGICYKFNVTKKDLIDCGMSKDDLIDVIGKKVDINCYNIEETNEEYSFKIKEDLLSNLELISFLKEQYNFFGVDDSEEIFNNINKLKGYDEIVKFANRKPYENFQQSINLEEIRFGPWKTFLVKYNNIIFFINGKAYMECYNDLLMYIEKLIKNKNTHKISGTVKAFLD